jgi:hypothetical protein
LDIIGSSKGLKKHTLRAPACFSSIVRYFLVQRLLSEGTTGAVAPADEPLLFSKEDVMRTIVALAIACTWVVPHVIWWQPAAWAGCTAQQRIELGNQGYDKAEVEKACNSDGADFWEILSKGIATGLANGLTNELNQALGLQENNNAETTPAISGARACITNAGVCPLSGGPVGYPCYCQAWNGATFTGLSK